MYNIPYLPLYARTHVFHNTAEENDFDFVTTEARNYTLTFTNQTSNQLCVTISLNEDQIAENAESFVVVLTAMDTDDTIGINSTTITINDNDGNLNSLCLHDLLYISMVMVRCDYIILRLSAFL